MGKGFGGFPGNMQNLMKQAQMVQKNIEEAQSKAEELTAEGSAGGGVVRVTVNGKHQMVAVALDPSVVDVNEKDMLQDLIMAATNEATNKIDAQIKEALSKATGGMSIPGLF